MTKHTSIDEKEEMEKRKTEIQKKLYEKLGIRVDLVEQVNDDFHFA